MSCGYDPLLLIRLEEVTIEEILGGYLYRLDDLVSGGTCSDERAVKTDSDHLYAKC